MIIKLKNQKPIMLILFMAFFLSFTIIPLSKPVTAASNYQPLWQKVDSVIANMDTSGITALQQVRKNWNDMNTISKGLLLAPFMTPELRAKMIQANITYPEVALLNAVNDFMQIDITDKDTRESKVGNFKAAYTPLVKAVLGSNMTEAQLITKILEQYTRIIQKMTTDPIIKSAVISMLGQNETQLLNNRTTFGALIITQLRQDPEVDDLLGKMGWNQTENSELIQALLDIEKALDSEGKAFNALFLGSLRSQLSLEVNVEAYQKPIGSKNNFDLGTITLAYAPTEIEVKAMVAGLDISNYILWESNHTNVVTVENGSLKALEAGSSTITLKHKGTGKTLSTFTIIVEKDK